jgi:hypothetical protein
VVDLNKVLEDQLQVVQAAAADEVVAVEVVDADAVVDVVHEEIKKETKKNGFQ